MDKYINTIPNNTTHIKIDVGLGLANVQSQKWLLTEQNLHVFMFEPNIDCILSSQNIMNTINMHSNSYTIIPVALQNINQQTNMVLYSMYKDGGTSSLYKPTDITLGPVKSQNIINVYSLKHFFDVFPWNKFEYIDYMKIDAQGSDFDIIKSAGDYIKNIVYITAEPESDSYENCMHNTEYNMTKYLQNYGFTKIQHPNCSDPTYVNNKYLNIANNIFIYQK